MLFFSASFILLKLCVHSFSVLHMIELSFLKFSVLNTCPKCLPFTTTFLEHCFPYINLSNAAIDVSNLGTESIFPSR